MIEQKYIDKLNKFGKIVNGYITKLSNFSRSENFIYATCYSQYHECVIVLIVPIEGDEIGAMFFDLKYIFRSNVDSEYDLHIKNHESFKTISLLI